MKKVASKIKSEFWNLVIIFELILVAKIIIALGLDGTFIYPDEVCIIRKAIYFSQNLNLDFNVLNNFMINFSSIYNNYYTKNRSLIREVNNEEQDVLFKCQWKYFSILMGLSVVF